MFNILLMVAGVLVYILLGIDPKVRQLDLMSRASQAKIPQNNFQNTYLGAILIFVAFLNATIDYYQIQKSEAILASFLALIPPSCRVVRDGTITSTPAANLVKGDVVLVVCSFEPHVFFPSLKLAYSALVTRHGRISSYLPHQISRSITAV